MSKHCGKQCYVLFDEQKISCWIGLLQGETGIQDTNIWYYFMLIILCWLCGQWNPNKRSKAQIPKCYLRLKNCSIILISISCKLIHSVVSCFIILQPSTSAKDSTSKQSLIILAEYLKNEINPKQIDPSQFLIHQSMLSSPQEMHWTLCSMDKCQLQ